MDTTHFTTLDNFHSHKDNKPGFILKNYAFHAQKPSFLHFSYFC